MPAALEIESLRKTFASKLVLNGVSFAIQPGQRLALLGPNGAGKTTLIRCISGLTWPDSGKIRLHDRLLPKRGHRHGLGTVPQEIALYLELSAIENLTAFGRFYGLRGAMLKSRIQWALSWTGLERQAHFPVKTFSGGMKRRINIACGILHRPDVVLLDEPTVGVDPQSRQRIYEMLDALRDEGTSILLTTHHLDEAESHCDAIVILDNGNIVAEGTLQQLIASTVGNQRSVRVRLDRLDRQLPNGFRIDHEHEVCIAHISDLAEELPAMLSSLEKAGCSIRDLQVEEPSLHHVFLHLTGRALRE